MNLGPIIGLISVILVFSIPIVAILSEHKRKMLEMKLKVGNQGDSGLRAEVDALREEVRSLRDTSMQYDLSFDTALQRMEQRVERMELRSVPTKPDERVQVGVGR